MKALKEACYVFNEGTKASMPYMYALYVFNEGTKASMPYMYALYVFNEGTKGKQVIQFD